MYGFIDVLHFQREQAPFFIEEQLGVIGGRLESGFHDFEEFILLIQFRRGQTGPDPVEKFRNIFLRNQRAVMHQRLDYFMVQTGLHRVEPLVPAYPQRHLAMKSGAPPVRGTGFAFIVVVHYGEGLLALALKHHVKAQTLLVKVRSEFERHG